MAISIPPYLKTLFTGKKTGLSPTLSAAALADPLRASPVQLASLLEHRAPMLFRRELHDLINARTSAEMPMYPNRSALQMLFKEAIRNDLHLAALLNKRVMRVANRQYRITRAGVRDEAKTKSINHAWFSRCLSLHTQARFFGYSLLEFSRPSRDQLIVTNFPRQFVGVDQGRFYPNLYDSYDYKSGVDFVNGSLPGIGPLAKWMLLIRRDDDDLGLLDIASALTILKRHSWASWDSFEKRFGVPIATAITNSRDLATLAQIDKWLEELTEASYARFPEGTTLDIKESTRTDAHRVFSEKINLIDAQISKLIEGSTLTSDTANNGNRSLGDVHQASTDEITADDLATAARWVNDTLLPYLATQQGYNFGPDDLFEFYEPSVKSHEQRHKDVDMLLRNGYKLERDFIEEVFEVVLQDQPDVETGPALSEPTDNEPTDDETTPTPPIPTARQLRNAESFIDLHRMYLGQGGGVEMNGPTLPDDGDLLDTLLADLYAAQTAVVVPMATIRQLFAIYADALAEALPLPSDTDEAISEADQTLNTNLRANARVFAAAKTAHEIAQFEALLFNDLGVLKPFAQFRAEALAVHSTYRGAWLQAEWRLATNAAQRGYEWNQIVAGAEAFPLLRYETIGDDRVRDSHRELDNIVRPVGDAFWNTYYPPNGWRCRCRIVRLMADEAEVTESPNRPELPALFQNNVGQTGRIFAQSHPYFADTTPGEINAIIG